MIIYLKRETVRKVIVHKFLQKYIALIVKVNIKKWLQITQILLFIVDEFA